MIPQSSLAAVARGSATNGAATTPTSDIALFVYGTLMAPEVIHTLLSQGKSQPPPLPHPTVTSSSADTDAGTTTPDFSSIIMKPARLLHGIDGPKSQFQLFPVRDAVFPALIPMASFSSSAQQDALGHLEEPPKVDGLYLPCVTPQQLSILDWYEEEAYERREVVVQLLVEKDSSSNALASNTRSCQTYIWVHPWQELIVDQGDWNYKTFRREHMESYLTRTVWPCVQQFQKLGFYSNEEDQDRNTND
ncbi:hypothetical protein ACA910_005392 [Epithemia clementina (nom. ined.)]